MTHFTWTMAQAKRDFQLGNLTSYHITRSIMQDGWSLWLHAAATTQGPLVDAREKTPRKFKTLDAVVAALEAIGFKVDALEKG